MPYFSIDSMLSAAEKTLSALDVAELCTLSGSDDVEEYVMKICFEYQQNKTEVDKSKEQG